MMHATEGFCWPKLAQMPTGISRESADGKRAKQPNNLRRNGGKRVLLVRSAGCSVVRGQTLMAARLNHRLSTYLAKQNTLKTNGDFI